ncbi:recombinase family protein, partial [Streptomyces sp. NPDC091204]|uniref:recombinase family protein n=1 Tax=Streptomyces sp. NPDC091204 TaxID=3155299 RepID=UPI003421B08D
MPTRRADQLVGPVRIGYARTSTARQELASQLEAVHRAECHKVFKEQISTRVKVRPEFEKALALAQQFKEAAPETPVIFTVHELKRCFVLLAKYVRTIMRTAGAALEVFVVPPSVCAALRPAFWHATPGLDTPVRIRGVTC